MLYKNTTPKSKVACTICNSYDPQEISSAIKEVMLMIDASNAIAIDGPLLIKPNLCLLEVPEKAITTHPEIVKQVALWSSNYTSNIIVGDSPVGDADRTRINNIWDCSGLSTAMINVLHSRTFFETELVEFNCDVNGQKCTYFMAKEISDIKTIINVPKFKTHSLMTYTGAIKNLYGLLPGNTKKILHSQFPKRRDFASLLVSLYLHVKPAINIVDAVVCLEGDGPGSAGQPRKLSLIMASEDAFALDAVAAKIMNISTLSIPTNAVALARGLLDESKIELLGESIDYFIKKDFKVPCTTKYHSALTKKLFEISRPIINIDPAKCTCCDLCVINCPVKCIDLSKNIAAVNKKDCISCMMCHEICPNSAVQISEPVFYKKLKERSNQVDSEKSTK